MRSVVALLFAAFASTACCAEPHAQFLVQSAQAKAAKNGKVVLVVFHASWCGYCHQLDRMLADSKLGKVFHRNYEIVEIDPMEDPKHKFLENPGGQELRKTLGGKVALPYFAVLNSKGKMLMDSKDPSHGNQGTSGNIGFPVQPSEIDYFMKILKTTAPKMSPSERAIIKAYLYRKK